MRLNGVVASELDGLSVAELLTQRGLPLRGIAVARNGDVVPRSQWATTVVLSTDQIEIVSAVAGG